MTNSLIPEWIIFLGGGFKYFLFSPLPGEMIQFDYYFSDGLKPPTSFFWGGRCDKESGASFLGENFGNVKVMESTCRSGNMIPTGKRWLTVCQVTHKKRALPKGTSLDRKFKKEQEIKQVGLVSTRDTQIPCQNGFFTRKM